MLDRCGLVVNEYTRFIIGCMKHDDEGRMGECESVDQHSFTRCGDSRSIKM